MSPVGAAYATTTNFAKTKMASEPAHVIGNPYEDYANDADNNPLRPGDVGCFTEVGAVATNHAGNAIQIDNGNVADTSTVLTLQPAWSTSKWDFVVGDYIRVGPDANQDHMRITAIDTANSQITVDRTVNFMPAPCATAKRLASCSRNALLR